MQQQQQFKGEEEKSEMDLAVGSSFSSSAR
jgi:hypothetical protein